MNGSSNTVFDPTEKRLPSSHLFRSSLGSISSSRKSTEISKTYKQASALFLTRRLSEALSTIQPLIATPNAENDAAQDEKEASLAPVAGASRTSRIKVWSFYLTILNAIAELGPEDGTAEFGNKKWKNVVTKAQDGSIWEEVVNVGYGGVEGNVDADVIVNLATLLLTQCSTQTLNQQHLESYLSASTYPNFDLIDGFGSSNNANGITSGNPSHRNGTDTPRDLESRTKIIELYTLHVLPRNGEWQYARDFIRMSEVLDEERRENFLQALGNLEDEEIRGQDQYEDAVPHQNDTIAKDVPLKGEIKTDSEITMKGHDVLKDVPPDSEKAYGIEDPNPGPRATAPLPPDPKPTRKPSNDIQPKASKYSSTTSPRKPPHASVLKRSLAVITALQRLVTNMTEQISQNPMSLLRFVFFIMGLIVAFSRRDVQDRLGRLTGAGWEKIRRTVGMGVKISYV